MLGKLMKDRKSAYTVANFFLLFICVIVYLYGTKVHPGVLSKKDGFYTPILTIDEASEKCPVGLFAIEGGNQYIGAYELTKLLGSSYKTGEDGATMSYTVTSPKGEVKYFLDEKYIISVANGMEERISVSNSPLCVEGIWYIPMDTLEISFGLNAELKLTEDTMILALTTAK